MNALDHRKFGEQYDLFSFFEEGPGFPVWHEKGLRIKHALIKAWRELHQQHGYQEIESPLLLDRSLWVRSGHCDHFEKNMYFSEIDGRSFAIKPMNCPGSILYFQQRKRSHAELPLRVCELGRVHRHENSGSLHGLMRVRSFVQDDAHIFCRRSQLRSEIVAVLRLIQLMMAKVGFRDYRFELSLRGESGAGFLGSEEDWLWAEGELKAGLEELGLRAESKPGEAKFYGPSLDLHLRDRHGRSWQCSSLQLDFNLPDRFGIHCFDEHGEREVPLMLHRVLLGSLERFMGILLEHYGRELPFWLHPEHYRILCVSRSVHEFACQVAEKLKRQGHFVSVICDDDPLKEKLRRSHEALVHSIVIIGEQEVQRGVVQLRGAGEVSLDELLKEKSTP